MTEDERLEVDAALVRITDCYREQIELLEISLQTAEEEIILLRKALEPFAVLWQEVQSAEEGLVSSKPVPVAITAADLYWAWSVTQVGGGHGS